MMFDALDAILLIPLCAAALLAVLPDYRVTAILNVLAALFTFLTSVSLFFVHPTSGDYLLVDDLNKVFIVLTTFVAFTTSVFSASYISHEIEIGRLTSNSVRFYHVSRALVQRGAKQHPDGISNGEGTDPGISGSRPPSPLANAAARRSSRA